MTKKALPKHAALVCFLSLRNKQMEKTKYNFLAMVGVLLCQKDFLLSKKPSEKGTACFNRGGSRPMILEFLASQELNLKTSWNLFTYITPYQVKIIERVNCQI
ncbi:hypothetical protein HS088_TW20G00270 [Tripterygium wilfordii]|uniref:Uncharacterized protein n=1 Tax=Tripterygium wilfordii TaxID=458696 RepID=A0A7J7C6X7_TRIWF|nr:hypothetical protein HS088_TW20G00270 [Tripterygium wilfordii]